MKVVQLDEVQAGQRAVIRRVPTSNPALLRYLGDLGVLPGAEIVVLAQISFDRTVRIRICKKDTEQVLGPEINRLLQVELL